MRPVAVTIFSHAKQEMKQFVRQYFVSNTNLLKTLKVEMEVYYDVTTVLNK